MSQAAWMTPLLHGLEALGGALLLFLGARFRFRKERKGGVSDLGLD